MLPDIKVAFVLLCSINILFISDVSAREWLIKPSVSTSAEYNDNLRLVENTQTEVSKVTLSPVITLDYQTPHLDISSFARLRSSRYDQQQFNSNDWYANVLFRKKAELSHIEFAVDYAYDSTLVSEIADTGLVQDNKRRSRLSLRPAWQYQLDFKNQLNINYSFDDVSYHEGRSSGLFNYDNQSLSTRLLHQLEVKTSVGIMAYASRFSSPDRGSKFIDIGLQGSYKYNLTKTMELELTGGVRHTNLEVTLLFFGVPRTVEGSDVGEIYSASLMRRWQHTRIEASLQRSIEPSGAGYAVLRNQVTILLRQQLTEKWSAFFSLVGMENNSLRDDIREVDRDYISFYSRLSWQWDPNITLSGLYRYRQQKYYTQRDIARGNSVEAQLVYRWIR